MSGKSHPPLSVVVCSLVLSGITFLILFNLQFFGLSSPDVFNLERFTTLSGQKPVVVALGTSKTRSGLYPDNKLAELIQEAGGEADYIRITRSGNVYENIKPALEYLALNPPSILLLESDLLVYSEPGKHKLPPWRLKLNQNIDIINEMTGVGYIHKENHGQPSPYTAAFCQNKKTPESLAKYQARVKKRRTTLPDEQQAYFDYLDQMTLKGTEVILLEIPRSPAANSVFPASLRAEAEQLQQILSSRAGFKRWTPPSDSLPEAAYCDQGHLSSVGQTILSQWIADKIANHGLLIQGRHDG